MYDSWTCLMVENGPGMLPDDVRTALKIAACDLHLKKWNQMHVVNDIIQGVIKTEWNTHMVGARSGVLFRAHIDCEGGNDFKVNFLFSEADLERGAELLREIEEKAGAEWGVALATVPVPALYQFYDLCGPSRARH